MIYWNIKKWIHISIENPFKTMNKLKKIFIPLQRRIIFGGKHIYYPFIYCPKPTYILIRCCDVMWKDKDEAPRYECPPYIWIHLFGINLIFYWTLVDKELDIDDYWEQALWYLYYYKMYSQNSPNIVYARESWPWMYYETKTSCWNDKYLMLK